MAATIKDIRDETGLSLATISKYLNGGNVLPENRERIDRAVEKLHYQVNEIARGLVTNRTKTIGINVFDITNIFNGELMGSMGKYLREFGYGMMICDSARNPEVEALNIRSLVNKKVDGIISVPYSIDSDYFEPARIARVPFVTLDREVEVASLDSVVIDNRAAAAEATQYLIDHGHRKIGIICSKHAYTGTERKEGFLEAMNKAGLPVPESYICAGRHLVEHGYQSLKKLASLEEPPTAIFMTNYDINLGVVMAMNEIGVRCPDDISLFGFDDLLLPSVMNPRLTVMKQPMEEMGKAAVDLLLKRVNMSDEERISAEAEKIVLRAEMLVGNSVKTL